MHAEGNFPLETFVPDTLLDESFPSTARKVTIKAGENISRGDLLGVDGTPEYLLSLSGAADGSEVPDAIAAHDCDATAGALECIVYFGGRFNENQVTLGAAHTLVTVREGLRVKGIILAGSEVAA